MFMPDVQGVNKGMGIVKNFKATIKEDEDSSKADVVRKKIAEIERQESEIADKLVRADETSSDMLPNKVGRVKISDFVASNDPDGSGAMKTTLDYDKKTGKPVEMHTKTEGFPMTFVQSDVEWDKDGHIETLVEKREPGWNSSGVKETLTIRHNYEKGTIYYEEKIDS